MSLYATHVRTLAAEKGSEPLSPVPCFYRLAGDPGIRFDERRAKTFYHLAYDLLGQPLHFNMFDLPHATSKYEGGEVLSGCICICAIEILASH